MSTDPCSVLSGGGEFGEEHLARPVVSSLLYNSSHGITPARLMLLGETQIFTKHSLPAGGSSLSDLEVELCDRSVAQTGPLHQELGLGVSLSR